MYAYSWSDEDADIVAVMVHFSVGPAYIAGIDWPSLSDP